MLMAGIIVDQGKKQNAPFVVNLIMTAYYFVKNSLNIYLMVTIRKHSPPQYVKYVSALHFLHP